MQKLVVNSPAITKLISKIPLPITEAIGTDSSKAEYKEWIKDELSAVDTDNSFSEVHKWSTEDDTKTGERVRNHVQLPMKRVQVTTRARDTDEYGVGDTLANQVLRRQQELRRDVEAIMLLADQPSAPDDATTGKGNGGKMGSLGTWIETSASVGADTGAAGGFNLTTGLTEAPVAGTARALTETLVRDAATSVWKEGGNPSIFCATPDVTDAFSNFLFDASARVATVQSDVKQSAGGVTAKGFIDVFESNNGVVLKLIGNRLQTPVDDTHHTAYLIDPMYLSLAYVTGYRVEPLAKNGPQEDRQMMVDVTLCVQTEKAHGAIFDIDPALTVTA